MSEQRVGEIARKVIEEIKKGIVEENRILDIDTVWCKIIDEDLKGHCYVLEKRKGILFVKVDSSCYLMEFKRRKSQILERLKKAGMTEIRDIKFLI